MSCAVLAWSRGRVLACSRSRHSEKSRAQQPTPVAGVGGWRWRRANSRAGGTAAQSAPRAPTNATRRRSESSPRRHQTAASSSSRLHACSAAGQAERRARPHGPLADRMRKSGSCLNFSWNFVNHLQEKTSKMTGGRQADFDPRCGIGPGRSSGSDALRPSYIAYRFDQSAHRADTAPGRRSDDGRVPPRLQQQHAPLYHVCRHEQLVSPLRRRKRLLRAQQTLSAARALQRVAGMKCTRQRSAASARHNDQGRRTAAVARAWARAMYRNRSSATSFANSSFEARVRTSLPAMSACVRRRRAERAVVASLVGKRKRRTKCRRSWRAATAV